MSTEGWTTIVYVYPRISGYGNRSRIDTIGWENTPSDASSIGGAFESSIYKVRHGFSSVDPFADVFLDPSDGAYPTALSVWGKEKSICVLGTHIEALYSSHEVLRFATENKEMGCSKKGEVYKVNTMIDARKERQRQRQRHQNAIRQPKPLTRDSSFKPSISGGESTLEARST